MNWFEALILGLIQGLTEFLPVSSSGHLEIGTAIFGIKTGENLTFSIVVHGATVLSILVVFFRDLKSLLSEALSFRYNDSTAYLLKIIVSMIPVGLVGVFFKDEVEALFTGNIVFVGAMLLVTATFLIISHFVRSGKREIGYLDAFIIGISQALAVIPGISRSGATITTALFLGKNRDSAARFSFLMVIVPIVAANFLDLVGREVDTASTIGAVPLIIGFLSAFISGWIACRWMITIVRKGKLLYFGLYCIIIGAIAIIAGSL
jgi:undecaprenyl-diphosphatase